MPYTRKGRYNQLILTVHLLEREEGIEMKIGKKYLITFETGGKTLTFTGTIISLDDNFIKFRDKFGKILNYKEKLLVSFEEVEE